jgi:acetyl-CoA carboxylase/biotin carboxylase 1
MATPEDLRANAEYIRMASEVVDVPGGSNNNNYANVSLIIDIAERRGVDAVWAGEFRIFRIGDGTSPVCRAELVARNDAKPLSGWGHASENPMLPDGLAATKRNIKFIGPSGAPMRALGDKIGSTIIAQSAGVPCIGWNGDDARMAASLQL